MKAKELELMIAESVSRMAKKRKGLKESLSYQDGEVGVDHGTNEKIEKAVMLAVNCAKAIVSKNQHSAGSIVQKCFDDILELFVDRNGEFTIFDPNLNDLKQQFETQLDNQMVDPQNKVARTSKTILNKAIDKLNIYMAESKSTKLYSIDEFHNMVREMIQDSIKEQMVNELDRLHLKELGGVIGTQETGQTQSSMETSGTSGTTGTKPGVSTQPGNEDPANSVLIPGTNTTINQGLQAAAKDTNFKRKMGLITKIGDQVAAMKGLVKESEEPMEEWQIIHRALTEAIRVMMHKNSALFDELADQGIAPAKVNQMIRAVENILDNLRQTVQLSKNVAEVKTKAMRALSRSPMLKRFLPKLLGGELETGLTSDSYKTITEKATQPPRRVTKKSSKKLAK